MNVKLLRKVAKHILEEPKRLVMGTFLEYAKCGTAACIAGWSVLIEMGEKAPTEHHKIYKEASKLLGLDHSEANRLFMRACWPQKFADKSKDNGSKKSARIAVERIEHFIRTKGRE